MKKKLYLTVNAVALAFTAATPAAAQEAEQGTYGADIVVTAQKRDQRLLDVPVAVSAIGSDTLVSQNINSLKDYFSRVPGLQYGGPNTASLSIRGVTTG